LEASGAGALPPDELRARLGFDQARWMGVGAAPTPVEVLEFFDALGMAICEVWGMSETSCIVTTNRPGATRFGSVGRLLDGMELWIADDGELLVRGPLVMAGYRNRPDLTAVVSRVQGEVDAANAHLSRPEQIKRFRLLPGEWLPGGGELTPT
jgi:long-chain acyl-CoA synthetase